MIAFFRKESLLSLARCHFPVNDYIFLPHYIAELNPWSIYGRASGEMAAAM
jgi:hypothetical protein